MAAESGANLLHCKCRLLCRFSAAGSDDLTMRSGGRRREKRQGTKSRGSGAAAVQRALWGFGCGIGLEKFAPKRLSWRVCLAAWACV